MSVLSKHWEWIMRCSCGELSNTLFSRVVSHKFLGAILIVSNSSTFDSFRFIWILYASQHIAHSHFRTIILSITARYYTQKWLFESEYKYTDHVLDSPFGVIRIISNQLIDQLMSTSKSSFKNFWCKEKLHYETYSIHFNQFLWHEHIHALVHSLLTKNSNLFGAFQHASFIKFVWVFLKNDNNYNKIYEYGDPRRIN